MLEGLDSWLSALDFSSLATELFGRPIGPVAATLLVAGALATGAIALLSLYYARKRFFVANRELALKEEASKKKPPSPHILVFGEDNVDSIVYLVPFDRKTLFSLPLSVGLKNDTDIEFKNLVALLRMNADAYGHEYVIRQPGPIAQAFGFERFEQDEDGTKCVVALSKVSRLPSGMTYEIEDFIFTSSSTIIEDDLEVDAAGGKVTAKFKAEIALKIRLNVHGENVVANSKDISVSFISPPECSIEEHFRSKHEKVTSSKNIGKTVIVAFESSEENSEYAEMASDFRRDMQLYRKDKKSGLRRLRKNYGPGMSDAEIERIIAGGQGSEWFLFPAEKSWL